ncbi:hypothetical protein CHS0354_041408 [Potamilus streckersoni]|uniref:Uncharacterized protein n=1 Tax=Potamilus streckersoni TaxID=2493646 RepID=A0AAE0T9Q8_9BIVA|nr:hypothetical protein CHS0354_041408 [Potamilus streckersoni]
MDTDLSCRVNTVEAKMNKRIGLPLINLMFYVVFKIGNSFVITSGKLNEAEAMEMANLPVTGDLTDETLSKMAQPRCGFPDLRRHGLAKFTAGKPWPKNELTWKITEYSKTSKLTRREQKGGLDHFQIRLNKRENKMAVSYSPTSTKKLQPARGLNKYPLNL